MNEELEFNLMAVRRSLLLGLAAFSVGGTANAQSAGQILDALGRAASQPRTSGSTGLPRGVSLGEADGGLREALNTGVVSAIARLGRVDGYWAPQDVRIPLPGTLRTIQRQLQPLGLSRTLDDLQLKLNRSAEAAVPAAGSIFADAIRTVTIDDVIGVLRGGETSGTDFLKAKTKPQLVDLFAPPMTNAVNQSGAGAAFDRVVARYGREIGRLGGFGDLTGAGPQTSPATTGTGAPPSAPSSGSVFGTGGTGASTAPTATAGAAGGASQPAAAPAGSDPTGLKANLVRFAADKALDGLFLYVANEERLIRRDPQKRVTDLLRRVFGSL